MQNNKKKLIVMCGPAGSGKTTWVQEHASPGVSAHISRDRIRFERVKPNEYYFSREDEVYTEFIRQTQKALNSEWVNEVYVDATHLTKKSREGLIHQIERAPLPEFDIIVVVVRPTLEKCLTQNALRKGRECVPETVITNMYQSFEDPMNDDIYYKQIMYERNED